MSTPTSSHPCFDAGARQKYGRVHLPVAPRCNMQCHYCNRKYDCMNETRPGVTSTTLNPEQALNYLKDVMSRRSDIRVMGIAGPGDPFACPAETMETLRITRREFPDLHLCVATNGLAIGPYIDDLAALKVNHVTLTINAVDPAIGAKIYAWIREDKRPLRGLVAAARLLECQLHALRKLKELGVTVKVNTVILPGLNDAHIPEVARTVAEFGADVMNCVPLYPVAGAEFENMEAPDARMTTRVRLQSENFIPQMSHCARCRADAVGRVGEAMTEDQTALLQKHTAPQPNDARPYIAVASMEGLLVNQHLGETTHVLICGHRPASPAGFAVLEARPTPEPGGGNERWAELGRRLSDCRMLVVNAAGPAPVGVLSSMGINVVQAEGLIEEVLRALFAGQPVPQGMSRMFTGCGTGASCAGNGTGCG